MRPLVSRWPGWLWWLPKAAILLLLVASAALIYLTHHRASEEQRRQLISDVLWLEQSLDFQLNHNVDKLREIGADYGHGKTSHARQQVRLLLSITPEFTRISWNGGGQLDSTPVQAGTPDDLSTIDDRARKLARPAYATPRARGADHEFSVHVPIYDDRGYIGSMVGVYSVKSLLAREIPWWFTERYRLEIMDDQGRVLARKSAVANTSSDLHYQVDIGPPELGLVAQATAYQTRTDLASSLIITAIVGLSLMTIFSLMLLSRHARRRVHAEKALLAAHAFNQAMENSLLTGMRAIDMSGRIIYVNPAFCRMVGFEAAELLGSSPPQPYWPQEDASRILSAYQALRSGQRQNQGIELRLKRRDGSDLDVLVYESPLVDGDGQQVGWMGSVLDITERKKARELAKLQEDKLQHTARLVSMGEMASSLAHELNQPLAAISGYAAGSVTMVERGNTDARTLLPVLKKIEAQAQRAGQIIRRVYDFVRRHEPERSRCDLNIIITTALTYLHSEAEQHAIQIRTELAPDLPTIQADRVLVEQLVFNLARNGMEAMYDSPPGQRTLRLRSYQDGNHLAVEIIDQGHGVMDGQYEKLFEPFFSSKQHGMGMGLNICRSIVEAHRGRLTGEACTEGGSCFRFTLELGSAP